MPPTDRPPALGELYADREPDPALEDRVADDFRRRSGPPRRGRGPSAAHRLAAGLVLFAAGFGAARVLAPATPDTALPETGPRPSFMLMLLEPADFGRGLPLGALATEYAGWARDLAASGVAVRGSELGAERAVLAPAGSTPEGRGEMRVGGYFVVEAADLAEARGIAATHPHVGHGGWIEVAPMR